MGVGERCEEVEEGEGGIGVIYVVGYGGEFVVGLLGVFCYYWFY